MLENFRANVLKLLFSLTNKSHNFSQEFVSEFFFTTYAVNNCLYLKSKQNRTRRARKEKSEQSLANIDIISKIKL